MEYDNITKDKVKIKITFSKMYLLTYQIGSREDDWVKNKNNGSWGDNGNPYV